MTRAQIVLLLIILGGSATGVAVAQDCEVATGNCALGNLTNSNDAIASVSTKNDDTAVVTNEAIIGKETMAANGVIAALDPTDQTSTSSQGGGSSSSSAPQTLPPNHESSVEKDAVDPTASLMSFAFRDIVTPNYYGRSGSSNQIQFQPAVPFVAWGQPNILRLTLPYNTGGAAGKGLGDVQLFDLVVFPLKSGRLGIGAVMNFAANSRLTTDRFQIGPALGYVQSKGKWTFGAFTQNLFSGDTKVTAIQPILAYQLGRGWAISGGDAQWTIDWNRTRFVNIPFGIDTGKIFKLGKQLVRMTVNPEYNAASVAGTPHWTIRTRFILLVPGK